MNVCYVRLSLSHLKPPQPSFLTLTSLHTHFTLTIHIYPSFSLAPYSFLSIPVTTYHSGIPPLYIHPNHSL